MKTDPLFPATQNASLSAEFNPVCDRFESACLRGAEHRIEDYLAPVLEEERSRLFRKLLGLELLYRRRKGEQPAIEEYRVRFAEYAAIVDDHFAASPSVVLTETTRVISDPNPISTKSSSDGHPTQIGKYRIVQFLGRGGQATVYRAVHCEIPGRDVVIKWANADLPQAAQHSILEEGRILAELEDPGLVRVYDVDVAEGRPYVVFEYISGRTLLDEARGTTIDPRRAAAIVADIAHTLEQAHRRGVLHRDLKPANILIDAHGRPRVLDFGLGTSSSIWTGAKEIDPRISGTLPYMAPEQAGGDASELGPRTDVFGLGAILYELLVGRPPHDIKGLTLRQAIDRVRLCKLEPPRKVRPTVPKDLDAIVVRALQADPGKRFGNAGEIESALRKTRKSWLPFKITVTFTIAFALLAMVRLSKPFLTEQLGEFGAGSVPTSSPPPPLATGTGTPLSQAPLEGKLDIRIWSADGKAKSGLSIEDFGALPVRNGEQVHVEASLNRAAWLYLLWIDSEGKVTRLDEVAPNAVPRRALHSPAKLDEGWEMIGPPGEETIVLLAAEKPLAPDADLANLVGTLPPIGPSGGEGYTTFEIETKSSVEDSSCMKLTGGSSESRGLGAKVTIKDPVVQSLERLRKHFDVVKAVRFAHR